MFEKKYGQSCIKERKTGALCDYSSSIYLVDLGGSNAKASIRWQSKFKLTSIYLF